MTLFSNILIVLSSLLDQVLPLFMYWLLIKPSPHLASRKFYITTAIAYSVICIVLSFSPLHYLIKTIIIFSLKILYCWKISDYQLGISLFLPIIEFSSIYACESTVPFVLDFVFPHIPFDEVADTPFLAVFGVLESRSLLYLLWGVGIFLFYYRQPTLNSTNIHAPQWIILCSAMGLMTSFVIAFQWIANSKPSEVVSILGIFPIVFLIVVVLFFLLAINLSREAERKYKLQGELLHTEQQLEQQKAIASMYEQMRGMQHDFRNHMQIIGSLAERQSDNEVFTYVEEIIGQLTVGSGLVHTGIEAIDALMNSKFIHAQNLGIDISAEVCFPDPLEIPVPDLCTALFNLLDNAIEACEKNQKTDSRYIHLNLYQHENFLVVSCSNPSEIKPISHKYGFRTTKRGELHGIGMRQLQRIAEKYNGFFHAEYQDGVFSAKLALSHKIRIKQVQASYIKSKKGMHL